MENSTTLPDPQAERLIRARRRVPSVSSVSRLRHFNPTILPLLAPHPGKWS